MRIPPKPIIASAITTSPSGRMLRIIANAFEKSSTRVTSTTAMMRLNLRPVSITSTT